MTASANSVVGSYTVTASAVGAATTVDFDLTNITPLSFSGLSNQSDHLWHRSSVTVTGTAPTAHRLRRERSSR